MSGIGLSGAHAVGKSTLAQACSDEYDDVVFVESEATRVITEAGFDPAADYDFETRLMLQELVLLSAIRSYEDNRHQTFITDRTPLDFATYLLTDVSRNNVSDELAEKLVDFIKRCYSAINTYFNVVIVVQPGIKLVEREGKGSVNVAYIEHFNTLISGLVVGSDLMIQHTFIPRQCTDLDKRVAAVNQSVKIAFNSFERNAKKRGANSFSTSVH